MEFEEIYNRHYIRTDSASCIIEGWSDGPCNSRQPTEDDILLTDKGGYQFRLFDGGEENPALFDGMTMIPLYRWDGSQVVPRSANELDADRAARMARLSAEEEERRANSPEARLDALELAMCEADEANEAWRNEIENALCEIDEESEG